MAIVDQEAVRRLAQYRPFSRQGLDSRAALGDLVLAAAVEAGGRIDSLGDCRKTCESFWGLAVELDELRSVITNLSDEGRLEKVNGGYVLSSATRTEIDLIVEQSRETERLAFEEWEISLRSIRSGLTDSDVKVLASDLEIWLQQVILRHGVEAALLLYPEDPRARHIFASLEKMGFNFLPSRTGELEALREQALLLFVRQPTKSQRLFLANLMETSYFLTVLSLDPAAREIVEGITQGQRVYLDTNICYRLLNLQTPRQYLSTQRMIQLTKELGYSVAVTEWTVNELRTSLERAQAYLKSKPIPPGELAALAASATTDENFITAYWRRLKEKPVSVGDFFAFYNEIEGHLAQHGVEVVSEGCISVDRDADGIEEQLSVIESVTGPRYKPDPVKYHDVKHYLLINRLRGNSKRRFANAGYWFLTADSSLPRYDYAARSGQSDLPFCVTASAWLQVTRSFVPRTQDYDQTLTDLLASPYLRYRGRISYETVQEVVSRIDLFTGATPDLAGRVLVNSALLRKVAETSEEAARKELIDDAVVAAASDLEKQIAETRERAEKERTSRIGESARAAALQLRLADVETKLRKQQTERDQAADTVEAASEEEKLEQGARITELENKLSKIVTIIRWVIGLAMLLGAVAGVSITIWSGAVTGPGQVTVVVVAGVLFGAGGVAIALSRSIAAKILAAIALVLTIAAAVYDFST